MINSRSIICIISNRPRRLVAKSNLIREILVLIINFLKNNRKINIKHNINSEVKNKAFKAKDRLLDKQQILAITLITIINNLILHLLNKVKK